MAEPGAPEGAEQPVTPPAEASADVTSSEQGVNQEAVSPQDVGAALIAENRRLGGGMELAIVPTAIGSSSKDVSTTILFPSESHYGQAQAEYRVYGVNSELGLVYYVDSSAKKYDSWSMTKYRLREGTLTDSQLEAVKTPEEMEAWTTSLNDTRERAERWAARAATQTEFERSLPQKAMELIQQPVQSNPQTPQGPIQ